MTWMGALNLETKIMMQKSALRQGYVNASAGEFLENVSGGMTVSRLSGFDDMVGSQRIRQFYAGSAGYTSYSTFSKFRDYQRS